MAVESCAAQPASPRCYGNAYKPDGTAVAVGRCMTSRALLVLSILVIGCGGKSLDDGGNNGDSSPGPNCPVSPQEGSSCKIDGLQCEYGNDIRSTCNTVLTCMN